MKRILCLLGCLLPLLASAAAAPRLDKVDVEAVIAGENITFTLQLAVDEFPRGGTLSLAEGQVALLTSRVPDGLLVRRDGDALVLAESAPPHWWSSRSRRGDVVVTFAVRAVAAGDWRRACVTVPIVPIRPVTVLGDKPDLEVRIDGARDLKREPIAGGQNRTSAFLGQAAEVAVEWKTAIRQLESELMASCDATTVASVGAGALRIKTVYRYQIAQGALGELVFDVPDLASTITQVGGADIQDWRIDRSDPKALQLRVTLGRPQHEGYALTVESERPLPAFPCTNTVPVLTPRNVIRAGGTLLLGTDSAVKIQPLGLTGLTQTDPTAFPRAQGLALPQRSVFTYQYAAMPYGLQIALDDIVTALTADIGLVAAIAQGVQTVEATVQVEVRDAPAREVRLFTDADAKWTIAAVTGPQVAESDVDIRNVEGGREIVVPFRQPASDTVLLRVRMEQPFAADRTALAVPRLSVPAARTQRGYIVVAAEKGLRLVPRVTTELRDVLTASTPVRVEGFQFAYRFREVPWKLELGVERSQSAIHSEVFHLISLGEGVMYVSAAITCHISGAPVQSLRLHVPASIATIDIIGAGIDNWTRSNDVYTVQLANRTMGDYTLLVTYDQPLNYRGADLHVGDIATLDTDSEMGYIAVATSAGLKLTEEAALPAALIRIARDELPPGYAATVTAPVIGAYKYVRQPHAATLRLTPLDSERVIDQVVDYLSLSTRIGRDGESVTRGQYFVKNASRQYVSVKLPPGASLWTVRQMMPDGSARDLASQQSGDVLLVPVDRPRDPNQAVSIEITYAEPGLRGGHRLRLLAPSLPETPVTYANWEIEAGDKLAISDAGGNMTPTDGQTVSAPVARLSGAQTCRFYRTANLSGDEPLCVTAFVVPDWMAGGSVRVLLAGAAAGLVLLILALVRRRPFWWALVLTALGIAAAQTRPGLVGVGVGLAVGVPGLCLFVFIRWLVRRARRPRSARPGGASVSGDALDVPPLVTDATGNPQGGGAAIRLLALLALVGGLVLAVFAGAPAGDAAAASSQVASQTCDLACAPVLPVLRVQRLEVEIRAPSLDPRAERTAAVAWKMHFVAREPGRFRLLGPASVLVRAPSPAHLRLEAAADGCVLDVERAGEYDLAFETAEKVAERDGRWEASVAVPASLANHFSVAVPAADMEIFSAQTVSQTVTGGAGETRAEGVLDTSPCVTFVWRPRARVKRLEQAVVYCDVDSVGFVRAGVVDVTARANYNIVQGEIREARLKIPAGVSVTSVTAPALATWSMDPATRELVALLVRPVSESFTLVVGLQAPCGGLPYSATLGVPAVENVQRQRGQFALAAPESILLRLGEAKPGELEGVTPVNTSDFPTAGNAALVQALVEEPLRRAFRYDDPAAVRIALRAEPVQPEIRVTEAGSFSIGDERNVFSTALDLAVAKAGVFGVKLQLPDKYDIETLTGRDVSHWDDTRRGGQGVEVFFKRRVLGNTTINLVLAQPQRGVADKLDVPRVNVIDAARHTGRVAVSAERGVRLTVDEQQGVSVRKPETGEKVQPAAVSFEILRPAWQVSLHTQVMAPVLKPEVLHCVDLAEGMLQHRVYVNYRIENAGIKTFRVRVPVKDATLSVSGRNIARVLPLDADPEGGSGRVWQVELHGKVEDAYTMTGFYQQPYDPASGGVTISAFNTLGVARQATWLVVTGGGRVQVEPRGATEGLKVEDARSLPDTFAAGDLSGAIRCYRALQPDYRCDLSVVRHGAAAVLPASVERAAFVTVLSSSGKLLTQATLGLKVGDLRFLKVRMPSVQSALWAALVNGAEVKVSRDGDLMNVPLENLTADKTTEVTLVYADRLDGTSLDGRRTLRAPRFPDVPLRNITWTFYVPPEYGHAVIEGDFDKGVTVSEVKSFERADYEDYNKRVQDTSIVVAKNSMKDVGGLLSSGRQKEAQQALQQAVNLSQADQTLNEDARIQYKNVVKQQVKMGLVNRREELRSANNIFDEHAPPSQPGFNGGNFNQAFVSQVEEQLSVQDRTALDKVATRIVEQQAAAAGRGTAINIAMPEHGRELAFQRGLQSEKGGALQIVFRFSRPSPLARGLALWPVLPAFAVLWGLLRLAVGGRKARVAA